MAEHRVTRWPAASIGIAQNHAPQVLTALHGAARAVANRDYRHTRRRLGLVSAHLLFHSPGFPMADGTPDRLWFIRGLNNSRGSTMRDPIERFGKSLLQQQVGLSEEWRKANPDTLTTPPAEPWQNEVRDFHGVGALSGHAWAHLREWWQSSK